MHPRVAAHDQWRNIEDGNHRTLAARERARGRATDRARPTSWRRCSTWPSGRSHRGSRDEEIVRFGGGSFLRRVGWGRETRGKPSASRRDSRRRAPSVSRSTGNRSHVSRICSACWRACRSVPEDASWRAALRSCDAATSTTRWRRRAASSLEAPGAITGARCSSGRALLRRTRAPARTGTGRSRCGTTELVRLGLEVVARRAEALADLAQRRASALRAAWAAGLRLQMRYAVHAAGRSVDLDETRRAAAGAGDAAHLERAVPGAPAAAPSGRARARHRCLVGPHRDDLELRLDGRDVRRFGSQGQCRAAGGGAEDGAGGIHRGAPRRAAGRRARTTSSRSWTRRARGRCGPRSASGTRRFLAVPRRSDLRARAAATRCSRCRPALCDRGA